MSKETFMRVEPYLNFGGRTKEALAFYAEKLGAKTEFVMHFKESPEAQKAPPDWQDKVLHTTFSIGSSQLMASDGMPGQPHPGYHGFSLSVMAEDVAAGEKRFNALADGGKITMPWAKTFWSPGFGMLVDKFGVSWMVSVEHKEE
jgi:PhnB protein